MAKYIKDDNGKKSGRTGANVHQRNGVVRRFTAPQVWLTPAALLAKSNFGTLSAMFSTLTQEQMKLWKSFIFYTSDCWNQPIKVSGKEAFIALNCNIASIIGDTSGSILVPPVGFSNPYPVSLGLIDNGISNFNVHYSTISTAYNTIYYCTDNLSPAIFKPKESLFKPVLIISSPAPNGLISLDIAFNAKFGHPTINGSKIFVRSKVIELATGLASMTSQTSWIVY